MSENSTPLEEEAFLVLCSNQFRVCKPTECSLWVEVACRIRTQNPASAWGPEGSRQALRVWWELGQRHVRVSSMGGSSSSRPEDGTVGSASASVAESSCRQKSCAFAPDARDVLWSLEVSICRWFHCQTTFLVVWLLFLSAVHFCRRHLKPTAGDRLHSLLCCKVLFFRHSVSLLWKVLLGRLWTTPPGRHEVGAA